MRRALVAAAIAGAFLGAASPAHALTKSFQTGLDDDYAFGDPVPAQRALALQRAVDGGASTIRIFSNWSTVAPTKPPSSEAARDPGWSGYDWSDADSVVRDVSAHGLRLLLGVNNSPPWAEAANRPAQAPPGTYRPSPTGFRDFAEAIARRYSGSYPDPERPGSVLPRVRYWQAWNEPNLPFYITPQWRKVGSSIRAESPRIYRGLLNSFYEGVKAVKSSNVVVTAGTAPYGDLEVGGSRIPPAIFWRELLCVRGGRKLRAVGCPNGPVRFDIQAQHAYTQGASTRKALNPDDVLVPDLARIRNPLKVAIRGGNVLPAKNKRLWLTEFSWASNPPERYGVTVARQAIYLETSFYLQWRNGVDTSVWFQFRDLPTSPQGNRFAITGGLFFRGATTFQDVAKPSYTAFRFPFTAFEVRGGKVQLWGLAPKPGKVTIQRFENGAWKRLTKLSTTSGKRMFVKTRSLAAGTRLRALQGSDTSLTFRVSKRYRYT